MLYTSTLTSKSQVTIPKEVRKKLGVKPSDRVTFLMKSDGVVEVKKTPSFKDLRGSLKSDRPPISDHEMDALIAKGIAEDYAKSIGNS